MKIDIITIFPNMFDVVLGESMMRIAQDKGLVKIDVHDLRNWTNDKHRTVDDKPFGGGPGMVMKIEPLDKALSDIKAKAEGDIKTILLTPQGARFEQKTAKELSGSAHIILVCGHYEGFDERVRDLVDMEISIGDYVLTCGELPAMVVVDSIVRLLPGVLGASDSLSEESFEDGLLEYPQYTRPAEYRGMKVPEILFSGDHKKINKWRMDKAIERTKERRPDLLANCQ
ncbi:MAG: tRNA (guanosine(37)-N1)-methyltransferase TrmD [Candidatus Omnitrophica bacterium]|nr:tRNA (guanosine(37)-N1)-methyltransferase TrmD [Candidatus Omnitrophota bacterium]